MHILISLVMAGISHFGKSIKEDHDFSFGLCILIVTSGMLQQGNPHEPNKVSSKMVFLCVYVFGFVILMGKNFVLQKIIIAVCPPSSIFCRFDIIPWHSQTNLSIL